MNRCEINPEKIESFPVQNNLCFICSNDSVSVEVAALLLQAQGFINSAEERQTILQVICQLLRVQWESLVEVMTPLDDEKSHFCATCFNVMTDIILLREKLFQIETEIRGKLTEIEKCVAMSWTEGGHILEEVEQCPGIKKDMRMTFRRQVMEEIWNKELLQQKVAEFHQTSNSISVSLQPSMVQLSLDKNIFKIGAKFKKEELMDMTPSSAKDDDDVDKVDSDADDNDDSDKNWIPPYSSLCDTYHSLVAVSTCVTDSDSEVCPSKKAKSPDVVTTLTTNAIQHVAEQPSFISSLSKSTPTKSESFVSPDRFPRMVKRTTPVIKSSIRASELNLELPISSRFQRRTLPTESPHNEKTKNETKSHPKQFDATEDDADKDWIPDEEKISDDSDSDTNTEKDDSEESTDEDENCIDFDVEGETFIDSDIEKEYKPKRPDQEKSVSVGSMSVASTSCSRQLFKPKFSRTSKSKKEQASIILEQPEATFIAKDKSTWTTKEPKDSQVVRDYEVLQQNGGLIGPAQNTQLTPVELFKLMFPPSLVELIVKYTNKHADCFASKKCGKGLRAWYPVIVDEMYAFVGILLLLGVEKKRNMHARKIWTTDERYSMPGVVATMSRDRFAMILNHLRFDDTQARKSGPITESENDTNSKRAYISELLDPFVEIMQSHLNPYDTLVLDEMLVKFRGHSKFRVYMKSKPGKYGLKFWAVCDVETGYILNISLYHGKVGDTVAKELGKTVVLDLVKKYFNSGRAVTMDNFFTSKSLGKELMKHKMSMLGTLNRNRMDVIPEFTDPKGRDVESSIFAFQGNFTMVSYMQRKNRAAILLSTKHRSAVICPETKNKPRMILDYNATKGGIDTADQMIGIYSCQRTTRRWPVKVFYALLDIAAFNAYAVQQLHVTLDKKKVVMDRRLFLRNISEQLMEPFIVTRVETISSRNGAVTQAHYRALLRMGYERNIKHPGMSNSGISDANADLPSQLPTRVKARRTCYVRLCRTITRMICSTCLECACAQHLIQIPPQCIKCSIERGGQDQDTSSGLVSRGKPRHLNEAPTKAAPVPTTPSRQRIQGIAKCRICKAIGQPPVVLSHNRKYFHQCYICGRWICSSHSARRVLDSVIKYYCRADGIECSQLTL